VPEGVADRREAARKAGLTLAARCVNQLQDFLIIAGSGFVVGGVAIWLVWLSRRHHSIQPR
jgi:hypothetical protein